MRVAVVVTVLNEAGTVGRLLDALDGQTRPPDEVVIVDGGSTDGTPTLAAEWSSRLPGLRVIDAPGADIARGRNLGIASSAAEIIAVTDAGCIPSPTWLAALAAHLDDPSVGVVVGEVAPQAASPFEECVARCSLTPDVRIAGRVCNPSARSLGFRRVVWERAGGFPEHPPFNRAEDGVFIQRAVRYGGLKIEPGAIVLWRPRGTYAGVFGQFYLYARGIVELGESRTFHTRTAALSAVGTGLFLWGCITGQWLPWASLALLATAYLARKARRGCFAAHSWRKFYMVPLILATIHAGTMAGMIHGTLRRYGSAS